jgi:hypothetical protein
VRRTLEVLLFVLGFTPLTFAQEDVRTFKTETTNAFVWGEDSRPGAVSSSIRDPVTGHAIHMLRHAGIEVSSQAGFERVGSGQAGKLMNFATTIVNTTQSAVSVRFGGASVEGHVVLPLSVVRTKKGLKKRERKEVWELPSMHCFSSGFLPKEEFFSPTASSTAFTVTPNHALTVSFVTLDPRYSSILCSVEGCYPKGTMRFSVTINATDFVFIWPGRSMFYCGA